MIGHQAMLLEQDRLDPAPSVPAGATHADFERIEAQIAGRILPLAADLEARPVQLTFRGQAVVALPIQTRRFVRLMARYISMN